MALIQFRRGSRAEWDAANPVLASGEPGLQTNNQLLKVGDGTRAWSSLPGVAGGPLRIDDSSVEVRSLRGDRLMRFGLAPEGSGQSIFFGPSDDSVISRRGPGVLETNARFRADAGVEARGNVQVDITGKTGSAAIEQAGARGIWSGILQDTPPNGQVRLRVSRASPDEYGAQHFLINPYTYGMGFEYPGVAEWWVGDFSVHHPAGLPQNAKLWVGDDNDNGGLRATARTPEGPNRYQGPEYSELSSQRFNGHSHGPLRLRVIRPEDSVDIYVGIEPSAQRQMSFGALGPDQAPAIRFASGSTLSSAADGTIHADASLAVTGSAEVQGGLSVGGTGVAMNAAGALLEWKNANNTQGAVGLAGAADALPSAPEMYLKVRGPAGEDLLIPAFKSTN